MRSELGQASFAHQSLSYLLKHESKFCAVPKGKNQGMHVGEDKFLYMEIALAAWIRKMRIVEIVVETLHQAQHLRRQRAYSHIPM